MRYICTETTTNAIYNATKLHEIWRTGFLHKYTEMKRKAYSLWVLFVSKIYCLCKLNLCWKYEIFISEHIVIHFIANRPFACCMLMIKAIEVTQVRYKPYSTIESTDFSNAPVIDNCEYLHLPSIFPGLELPGDLGDIVAFGRLTSLYASSAAKSKSLFFIRSRSVNYRRRSVK